MIVTFGGESYCRVFKRFLLSWGEPTYIKVAKVRILEKLICKDNQADIINEMAEYLYDEDISA